MKTTNQLKVAVITTTSLRMTEEERQSLISPHFQLTILFNAKRTIAHVLGLDFGSDIMVGYLRMKFNSKLFRGESDYAISKWMTVRLRNFIV